MKLQENPPKNNFATAPAFPIIEAAAFRGDIRLFDESNLPPLTDAECRADEQKTAPKWPTSWLFQVDARGKEPNKRRLWKLAPVFNRADYVIICEDKPDFLTTVYAVGGVPDQGNTVLIGNAGDAVLDWYAVIGRGRDMNYEPLCVSIVTSKQMTALQEYMEEHSADALAMLNPDYARRPEDYFKWNADTGRYEIDREKFDAWRVDHE